MRRMSFILGILVLWGLGGIARGADDANAVVDPSKYDHVVELACVGDSITEGVGTSRHRATSWPAVLGKMLGEKWKVGNYGSSGRTLLNHGDFPYQTKGALKAALKFEPDVVIIMLGTNDTKAQNWKFKEEFIGDYQDLIGKFSKLESHPRIFVCTPPTVFGDGAYGINEAGILAEIPMVEQVAKEAGAGVIDIHAVTADHSDAFPDHVHPNDAGAEIIARGVFKGLTGGDFVGEIPMPTTMPAAATQAGGEIGFWISEISL
jgi:acyl-CoA thioesterase I